MSERGQGKWSALGFTGATHGNHTSFALSPFRGSPVLPSLNWPTIAYPTGNNESATLESVKSALSSQRSSGKPVAAVVIEPMQSQSGHAVSDQFLKDLRSVTQDSETALIVDATETGCGATGKSFWGFNGSADYLVFGKRTQVEGFYSRPQSKASAVALGGDHLRLLQFQVINEVMTKDRLIDKVDLVGASMRKQVQNAASKSTDITGVRGLGTSLYIDTKDGDSSYRLQQHLLKEGILTKLSGNGIALKPALILDQKHVDQFTAALSKF
jgi:4-aminobutyrate aminotransferase-like enzyme